MALDEDLFKAVAPEFASLVDPIISPVTELVPVAENEVTVDPWGAKRDHGVALLVAHMLAMANKNSSPSGALKKLKVGQMEKEFAQTSSSAVLTALDSTSYGIEFKRVRKTLVTSPFIC